MKIINMMCNECFKQFGQLPKDKLHLKCGLCREKESGGKKIITTILLFLIILCSSTIEAKEDIGKFTQLNKGHCTYWNQDIDPRKYIQISCREWLDIVMDNPNKKTECILEKCPQCLRHTPNVIFYEGKWRVIYGWSGPYLASMDNCGGLE